MLGGIRRILVVFVVVAAATALVSLVGGLAVGAAAGRAVATGFYLVGAFFLVAGVAVGARGPVRPKAPDERNAPLSLFGLGIAFRGLRAATGEERRDSVALTWLFLGVGTALILLGVAADTGVELV